MTILSNQVACDLCGDNPWSANRHDFRTCKCGAISVDGGMDYLRRVGNVEAYTDKSIELPSAVVLAVRNEIQVAVDRGCNSLGILCAVARALRDNGVTFNVDPIAHPDETGLPRVPEGPADPLSRSRAGWWSYLFHDRPSSGA